MGLVTYSPGIQFVNGALAKPKKQDGHKHGDYLIGTHRTAATTNPNCTRLYLRKADAYTRSTQPSADEMAAREKFAAVARAVALRKKNLSQVATDQANFAAQTEYKTMRSYLWSLESASYDANH